MPILDKDMTLCISLAGRPSNIGTRFHNFLYDELGLPFVYKAFTTDRLADAVAGVRGLGIRGCSVSMPFKEDIIALVDEMTPSARAIGSVNTVVNDHGRLTAYNTDFLAVQEVLTTHRVDPTTRTVVRGTGGMAKAVVAALRGLEFENVTVWGRRAEAAEHLAQQYGYHSIAQEPGVGDGFAMLVNVTPIGMTGANQDQLSFADELVRAAEVVFDVVAFPAETPFVRAGRRAGATVITGAEVIALQAARQFELYTGVQITADQVARASDFSRA